MAHSFEPVGYCIYCGARDRALSREHIIPAGLNGNITLHKASCSDCATITGRFEQSVLRGVLLGPRALMEMQSKRQPATHLEVLVEHGKEKLPIDEAPILMVMPKYQLPAAFGGPQERAGRKVSVWLRPLRADFNKLLVKGSFATPVIHNPPFCRMLAKIAHSFAAATLRLEKFRPFLTDYILKESGFIHQFIGGTLDDFPQTEEMHSLRLIEMPESPHHVGVEIRLFGNLGGPVYVVAVGDDRV